MTEKLEVTRVAQAFESAQAYAGVDDSLMENLVTWRRHFHANPEAELPGVRDH